ncbi:MAG: hypothetical protein ABJL54_18835 [Halioglobus sp.]
MSTVPQHQGLTNTSIKRSIIGLIWPLIAYCAAPAAQDTNSPESQTFSVPDGRHRFDLGYSTTDASEGEYNILLPGYSLAFANGIRFGIATAWAESVLTDDLSEGSDKRGLGDTSLQLQYAPSVNITASPWVPDSIGLSATVVAPTGDPDKGLGGDNWILDVGLGWFFETGSNLWLAPAGFYENAVKVGSDGIAMEEIGLGIGLIWLFDNGVWIGYTPELVFDMEADSWADDHSVIIGKMFSNGFGLSLEYGRRDRLDPIATRDDYVGVFSLYYQFGNPP